MAGSATRSCVFRTIAGAGNTTGGGHEQNDLWRFIVRWRRLKTEVPTLHINVFWDFAHKAIKSAGATSIMGDRSDV
jgi:hypothetical protein